MNQTTKKPWAGRFEGRTDPRVDEFTGSVAFDWRLALEDVAVNRAHGRMLNKIGLLSDDESREIQQGLDDIEAEIKDGRFHFRAELEDVHMNIEAALIEKLGPVGAKIHTARSRNDQVAADLRLYLRAGVDQVLGGLLNLRRALLAKAQGHVATFLPGYTHLQRAQPIRLAHHFLAYDQMLKRDQERFTQARARINQSPLGAAALAGTSFPVDREMVAQELGFEGLAANSVDAASDRDFVLDFLYAAATLMVHLSRLAEELVLWSSQEFGFVELADEFATGSSIMPQKKNPDVAELIRAKSGRVCGHLTAMLIVLKGLPLAYNKDLQEDKEPVFDTLETLKHILGLLPDVIASLAVKSERMLAACHEGFLEATDLADWLASRGVPFREAHRQVGELVKYCQAEGKRLGDLDLKEMIRFCPAAEAEIFEHLDLAKMVDRRTSLGGTSEPEVRRALARAAEELK